MFQVFTRVRTLKRPNWCEGDICILSLHFNVITIMSWCGKPKECTTYENEHVKSGFNIITQE
jgi:hypothetical protein